MELNWTTLVLEIVNFIVLVWILRHFLYQPVLRVIEERRTGIEATLTEARQRQDEAERLRGQYENRLTDWQRDKQLARDALQQEIRQQRSRAMAELGEGLAAERQKAQVIAQRHQREIEEGRERAALELGARFAARLLQDLSGPELDGRILELVCVELARLPDDRRNALRRAAGDGAARVEVISAHALDATQRERLTDVLEGLLGGAVNCSFDADPALIAGLRLSLGDWLLAANLRDELKGFSDQAHGIG